MANLIRFLMSWRSFLKQAPVSISVGDTQATSILTSSTAGGTATVRAKSGTGMKNDVAIRFV